MTLSEKLLQNANYILFPTNRKYINFECFPDSLIKMPIIENSDYGKSYSGNEHHFKPFYHIEYVLPILEDILHFGYKRSDFVIVDNIIEERDFSYLKPKQPFLFDVYNLRYNTFTSNVDTLRGDENTKFDFGYSQYHKLYIGSHISMRIINKNAKTDRILVLSCDSQMIPTIPVLCCYFKEVWALDNRCGEQRTYGIELLNHINVTDVLIEGGFATERKYTELNFI